MNKILTIVVPTYNMEKYLRRCLDSLIMDDNNLFHQVEVLVINDGSKDGSSAIAHEYGEKYPETFRVIDKENGNYGSCSNKGLKEAKGVYFRLLDADDYFVKGSLATFLAKLISISDDIDVVYTPYQIESKQEKYVYKINELVYNKTYDLNQVKLPKLNYINYTMHALTYKTDFLRNIGFYQQEGISYTDTEYVYYPFILAKKFMAFDLVLYNYVIGIESQTVSVSSMRRNEKHYWKLIDRFLVNSSFTGNLNAYQIRKNILTVIVRPIMDLYIQYSDYDKEKEKSIRQLLLRIKDSDILIYKHIISLKRKKFFF